MSDTLQFTLIVAPLVTWLLFILPFRIVSWARRPRFRSVDFGAYRDVTRLVAAERWWRRLRTLAIVVAGLAALSLASGIVGGVPLLAVVAGIVVAGTVAAAVVIPRSRVRLTRTLGDLRSGRGILGLILQILARVVAVLGLLLYLLTSLSGPAMVALGDARVTQQLEALFASGSPWDLLRAWFLVAAWMPERLDVQEWRFLVLVLVFMVLYLVDRAGAALGTASLARVARLDPRPPILYLRSFDEDRLRVPAILTRTGIFARLSPLRRRRFEEVLVRVLGRYGPVVAIAPPGAALPAIGAARASFSNDQWRTEVEQLTARAFAIVISGTPREVREGLGWEIEHLATLAHSRVVIVRAPWRRPQVDRRWFAFLAAALQHPRFAALGDGRVQEGMQFAVATDEGWSITGSKQWTDWSYGVAATVALDPVADRWRAESAAIASAEDGVG